MHGMMVMMTCWPSSSSILAWYSRQQSKSFIAIAQLYHSKKLHPAQVKLMVSMQFAATISYTTMCICDFDLMCKGSRASQSNGDKHSAASKSSASASNGVNTYQRSMSAAQKDREQAKLQKFNALLNSPPRNLLGEVNLEYCAQWIPHSFLTDAFVSVDELRSQSWSGIPSAHRAVTWKILSVSSLSVSLSWIYL